MSRTLALVVWLATATTAHADVWQKAIEGPAVQDKFDLHIAMGDQYAQRANGKGQNEATVAKLVDQAIDQYREAAKIQPTSGEPYFRIASVLESFFTDCSSPPFLGQVPMSPPPTCPDFRQPIDLVRAKQAVAAWDAFEARVPLDPRLADALFSRAILRTKLVETAKTAKDSKVLLEGALTDYMAMLDRADGLTKVDLEQVWGNLAETHMMLGKLEPAIDAYRTALAMGGGASTAYGLAVALDRDDSPAEALAAIRAQSIDDFRRFQQMHMANMIFYVPKGEEFYYLALVYEALGFLPESINNWRLYIRSGAHPQYQPRAKAHLDALLLKQKHAPPTPPLFRPALNGAS